MRASLDTNAVIHFYQAGREHILFEMFQDGVIIYEQIRKVELEHHAGELLERIDADLCAGKIELYTYERLKKQNVHKIFEHNVKENRLLYGSGDLGEVYAISLAQTIGAYCLVTDDIKQGGPYQSLLQLNFEDEVQPFHFADLLILRYLRNQASAEQTIRDFSAINKASDLNWSFRSKLAAFIKRFWSEPYKKEETEWIEHLLGYKKVKPKLLELRKYI